MIHCRHGLRRVVQILKKSGKSLVDQILVYHLRPTAFGLQLKLSLLSREELS